MKYTHVTNKASYTVGCQNNVLHGRRNESQEIIFPQQTAKKCILICDDSIEEMRLLVDALRSSDYRIIVANNGKEACDRASVLQPDLILMDINMPIMDGFTACRLLKSRADTSNIPLIFLTAANESEDRIRGLQLGAVDYISKSASEEEVLLRVRIHTHDKVSTEFVDRSEEIRQSVGLLRAFISIISSIEYSSCNIESISNILQTPVVKITEAFRDVLGCTLYSWLREQRFKRACQWLVKSNLTVNIIAKELAYSSSANFATAFKDRFGVSPREFRKGLSNSFSSIDTLLTVHEFDLPSSSNPWALLQRNVIG